MIHMASITLDKKEWLKHLGQFGESVNDLKLILTESKLSYSVGFQTHYLSVTQTYPQSVKKTGDIHISSLDKVCAFLKKCEGLVTLKQMVNGKTLYISSGNFKMQLPVTDCKSTQMIPTYERLVKKAEKSMWESFGQDDYTLHGKVEMKEILKLASLKRLMDKNADFVVVANADSEELSVSAGKQHTVKLFASSKLIDVEGPKHSLTSNYGPWLLPCLSLVDNTLQSTIHFGMATGLVVQQSTDVCERLLIIIDQEE